jgi:hypothetical protein
LLLQFVKLAKHRGDLSGFLAISFTHLGFVAIAKEAERRSAVFAGKPIRNGGKQGQNTKRKIFLLKTCIMDGSSVPVRPPGFGGLMNGPPSPARFGVGKPVQQASLTLPNTPGGLVDLFVTAPLVSKV